MDARDLALAHARGRMVVGASLTLFPRLAGRFWIGADASRRPVTVLARAMGARDLAIGLGVAIALDRGAPVRGWLEAGTLSDSVDFAATALAGDSIPTASRRATLVVASGSALLGAALARTLDEPVPRGEVQAPEAALTGHPPA
jgi:hypothetical protein